MTDKHNQHIEDYLDQYRKMEEVDFAVMITGAWGCGKTHFIKNYLKRKCITAAKENEFIYISLNGLASTGDIDMALFQAVHPLLGSKAAVTTARILKASLKFGCKINLDVNRDGTNDSSLAVDPEKGFSLAKMGVNAKGKLLVFDDLERCLLKPEEILGYINAFVENSAAKVIVVCEEGELIRGAGNKYSVIKEKVIGKTFLLNEHIDIVLGQLVSEAAFPETCEVIRRNREDIIKMFKRVSKDTGKHNYRALKHCFRDFECFYSRIDEHYLENDSFVNSLMYAFVALDYELHLNEYALSELSESQSPFDFITDTESGEKDNKSPLDVVLARHGLTEALQFVSNSWSVSYDGLGGNLVFDRLLWLRILGNVQIAQDHLVEAVRNSVYFPDEQLAWVRLWHYYSLEDDVAEQALEQVKTELLNKEYRSREVLLHVFCILKGLDSEGVILWDDRDVEQLAKQYLSELVDEGMWEIPGNTDDEIWSQGDSFGLGFWGDGQGCRSTFTQLIKQSLADAESNYCKSHAEEWMEQLAIFPGEFYPLLDIGKRFRERAILHVFKAEDFLDCVAKIPNGEQWMLRAVLNSRYTSCRKVLAEELPFIEELIRELDKRLSESRRMAPSVKQLKHWRSELDKFAKFILETG